MEKLYCSTPADLAEVGLKDSGSRQEFSTGAVRDNQGGKGRYDLMPMHALFRLARVFEKGAIKYDDDNWRKGIPLRRYLDSALRHLCKFAEGHRDEDHAAQAMWNLACMVETEHMIHTGQLPAELNDLPDWTGQRKAEVIGSEAQ
jgi:hypothetical protein